MLVFPVAAGLADSLLTNNTTFTLVAPLVVLILAGFFTLRSNVAKIWKDNYEAKVEEVKVLTLERDTERDKKHDALTNLASAKNLLLLEQAKTDLAPIVTALGEQRILLEQIRDAIGHLGPSE